MHFVTRNMIDILAAVLFDNVPYRLRKCSWFITADADMIAVLASDIDHRNIIFQQKLGQMLFDNVAEISADLDHAVKIIKIRNIKRNTVSLIIIRELAVVAAAV